MPYNWSNEIKSFTKENIYKRLLNTKVTWCVTHDHAHPRKQSIIPQVFRIDLKIWSKICKMNTSKTSQVNELWNRSKWFFFIFYSDSNFRQWFLSTVMLNKISKSCETKTIIEVIRITKNKRIYKLSNGMENHLELQDKTSLW